MQKTITVSTVGCEVRFLNTLNINEPERPTKNPIIVETVPNIVKLPIIFSIAPQLYTAPGTA